MNNDVIKKLAEQAGIPVSIRFDKWCEKFAELIIKECAKEVKDFYNCESIICYNAEEHLLGTFLNYFQEEE